MTQSSEHPKHKSLSERLSSAQLTIEPAEMTRQRARQNSLSALRMVSINMPWLSSLAVAVTVVVDERINIAAVSASGRVLVNPLVFSSIPLTDAMFIMAHELLHLALDTFGRATGFDDHEKVNHAHDYIINDLLRMELGMSPPLNGLELYGAANMSLEKVMAWMTSKERFEHPPCWEWYPDSSLRNHRTSKRPVLGTMSAALLQAGLAKLIETSQPAIGGVVSERSDLIFPPLERELFPGDMEATVERRNAVLAAVQDCLSLQAIQQAILASSAGVGAGGDTCCLEAIRNQHQPPWEAVLQQWMGSCAPGHRTYARPSRRGADRSDCVLPGKNREGWTLNIVLDTSGSMFFEGTSVLQKALGIIADFGEANGVTDVHILQCDVMVTIDEWVEIENLSSYRISGFGGSDMSPAMLYLASDPEVTAIVVITDGDICYPAELADVSVLWALTSGGDRFKPAYGNVVPLFGRQTNRLFP